MGRNVILAVAVVFLLGFLAITIEAAIRRGFTILSLLSIGVLVVMGIGIVGALLEDRGNDEHHECPRRAASAAPV